MDYGEVTRLKYIVPKNITSDQVKKEMAGMGRKMGILLKSDKILNMYD